jgi:copper chaperone NosL
MGEIVISRTARVLAAAAVILFCISALSYAGEPVKPKARDKCPVCGMFVAPHTQWIAEITFKDGTYEVFDGPKDMLRYYFNISKYSKNKTIKDISEMFVTEYYSTKMMRAREVFFVVGSDVMGPMGRELIPVKGAQEARTFMRDHRGKKIFKFEEIKAADIPH